MVNDYPYGLNMYFNNSGFNFINILKNMGSTLIYLLAFIVAYLILIMANGLKFVMPRVSRVTELIK